MAPPPPRHSCECHGALPRNPRLLYPRQTNRIEGIFQDIGVPVPWPSTINSLWSNLLTAVKVAWTDFGHTLSDIEKPVLENSGPVTA